MIDPTTHPQTRKHPLPLLAMPVAWNRTLRREELERLAAELGKHVDRLEAYEVREWVDRIVSAALRPPQKPEPRPAYLG